MPSVFPSPDEEVAFWKARAEDNHRLYKEAREELEEFQVYCTSYPMTDVSYLCSCFMTFIAGGFSRAGGRVGDAAGADGGQAQGAEVGGKQAADGERPDQGQVGAVSAGVRMSGKEALKDLIKDYGVFMYVLCVLSGCRAAKRTERHHDHQGAVEQVRQRSRATERRP